MVVKILSASGSFKGVSYNTNKVDQNKGELMKVKNFGSLQTLDRLGPTDFINYLKMVSAQNQRVKAPQLHVAISAKGKSHNKEELTDIAEKWLEKMGYSKQPYLIIFHNDTKNNHVHIVSSRIDKSGLKISSAFEKRRAVQNLYNIMELDPKLEAVKDLKSALDYKFSSIPQFKMILESKGYSVNDKDGKYDIVKFGEKLAGIAQSDLVEKIKDNTRKTDISDFHAAQNSDTEKRRDQLRAIFHKYSTIHDTTLFNNSTPLPGGFKKQLDSYSSDFRQFFKNEMNVDIVFHSKNGMSPYGYSVVDHKEGNVFKGGEIMALNELLSKNVADLNEPIELSLQDISEVTLHDEHKILQEVSKEVSQDNQKDEIIGDYHFNESNGRNDEGKPLELLQYDTSLMTVPHEPHVLQVGSEDNSQTQNENIEAEYYFNESDDYNDSDYNDPIHRDGSYSDYEANESPDIKIDISDDIDDEAILGRNRHRKKQARTNTR